jgi:tetratricopeptide (TPR) repeat protein
MARYLQQRSEARAAGLVSDEAAGEVEPFEAAPVQTVDPRLAWDETLAALRYFGKADTSAIKAPPDWPLLVASQEPAVALAFVVGNFPQLVRHVQPLLHTGKRAAMRPTGGRAISVPALQTWAGEQTSYPAVLLALGSLRLARQFEQAGALLEKSCATVSATWRAALANEEAALAWHAGKVDEALKLWNKMEDCVPVLFNRGMAALFMDMRADAAKAFKKVVRELPEESAWHHLAQLYLALAQMRG